MKKVNVLIVFLIVFALAIVVFVSAQPILSIPERGAAEIPTEPSAVDEGQGSNCYIDNVQGYSFCYSSPHPASYYRDLGIGSDQYTQVSNCRCIEGEPSDSTEINSCSFDTTIWEVTEFGDRRRQIHITRNSLGDNRLCKRLCAANRTLVSHSGYRCYTNEDWGPSISLCGAVDGGGNPKLYTSHGDTAQECFARENNGDPDPFNFQEWCAYADASFYPPQDPPAVPSTEILKEPCCLDQDGDRHGVEEYATNPPDYTEPGGACGDDCNDQEKGVWYGCGLTITDPVEMHFSSKFIEDLQAHHVDINRFTAALTVGKNEKCFVNNDPAQGYNGQDWNGDGWIPRDTTECIYGGDELLHPHTREDEYPLTRQIAAEGNTMECLVRGNTEPTKWHAPLSIQNVKTILQTREKPGDTWESTKTITYNLENENCTILANLTEHPAWNESLPFICNFTFNIEREYRGREIRCFAHPFADQVTDYWKSKNKTSYPMAVAKFISIFYPVDRRIERIGSGMFDVQRQTHFDNGTLEIINAVEEALKDIPSSPNGYVQYSNMPIRRLDFLSQRSIDATDAYLNYYSEALSSFEQVDKQIFVLENREVIRKYKRDDGSTYNMRYERKIAEDQATIENITYQVFRGSRVIVVNSIELQVDEGFTSFMSFLLGAPGVLVKFNGQSSRHALFMMNTSLNDRFVIEKPNTYRYNSEHSHEPYPPVLLPMLTPRRVIINGTTWTIDLGAAQITTWGPTYFAHSGMVLEGSDDPFTLKKYSHEKGHVVGALCDEYSFDTWFSQNGIEGEGCPNPFPVCCTAAGGNTCGREDACPGTPFINQDFPDTNGLDPIGSFPNLPGIGIWEEYSIMGAADQFFLFAGINQPLTERYPIKESPTNPDVSLCPLRSYLHDQCQLA